MDFRLWMLGALAVLGFIIYDWCLQGLNAYGGMLPISAEFGWAVILVFWIMLTATVVPRRIKRPSDLFLLFYSISCLMWGSILWNATGLLQLQDALVLLLLLYLPALSIKISQRVGLPIAKAYFTPVRLASQSYLYLPLTLMLAFAGLIAFGTIGAGDFGIDNVYDRRLAGRDALQGQVLVGYAINMTVNGAAPLLAFLAGWRRSPLLLGIVGCFVVLMFWLLGLKSPIINVAILFVVGFFLRTRGLDRWLVPALLAALVAIFAFSTLEILRGGYSTIADYGIRRVILVQPQIQSFYIHRWLISPLSEQLLGGSLGRYSDWGYLIGDLYLHNVNDNANTNGFLYALMQGGLAGYVAAIVIVTCFCTIADAFFETTGAAAFLGLTGLYGILVSEQNYTTALASSGIALCLALTMLFSYPSRRRPRLMPMENH